VAAASQKASSIALGCAVALSILAVSILARLMSWQMTLAKLTMRTRFLRELLGIATTLLLMITCLALGGVTAPAGVDTTGPLFLVAMGTGWAGVAYATYRRRR